MITVGYDHQVTSMARPKIGFGITAVGSATMMAINTPLVAAMDQCRGVHWRSTSNIGRAYPMGYAGCRGVVGNLAHTMQEWIPTACTCTTPLRRTWCWTTCESG